MKRPISYRPKYSLSIAILREVIPKGQLDLLIDDYVKAKKAMWKKTIKEK